MISQPDHVDPPAQILRLFQYGSAECDQFEIPNDDTFESRRPIEQPFFLSANIKIHQVACGALHTLILSTTGQVYSWGCNDDGALGRLTLKDSSEPLNLKENEPMDNSGTNPTPNQDTGINPDPTTLNLNINLPQDNVLEVPKSPTKSHSMPIEPTLNPIQPKEPQVSKESFPGLVPLDFPIDMISAGDSHSVACNSKNGLVYMWGVYRNTVGGNMCQPHRTPIRWGEDEFRKKEIQKVLSGCNHSLILADERVYVWGDPDTCVLGRMPLARRKLVQGLCIEALSVKPVEDVFTGGYHSFVKQKKKVLNKETKNKEDRSIIFAWGLNNYGQLGIGNTENTYKLQEIEKFRDMDIIDMKGGDDFTIALNRNGEVYSFGRCDDGQLGLGEDWKERVAEVVKNEKKDEKSETKEEETKEEEKNEIKEEKKFNFVTFPIKIEGLEKIDQIFSGSCYNYAISRAKDQVYSWGSGDHYVLGNGKEDQEMAPFTIKNTFYKLEQVIGLGLGGQHVTLITSNVANGWKFPELEDNVKEVDRKFLVKSRGRKADRESKSKSKSKSKEKSPVKEKPKSQGKKLSEIPEKEEKTEERNVKKRKMVEKEDSAAKTSHKKIKGKH